jgi:hypothetical protein
LSEVRNEQNNPSATIFEGKALEGSKNGKLNQVEILFLPRLILSVRLVVVFVGSTLLLLISEHYVWSNKFLIRRLERQHSRVIIHLSVYNVCLS